MEHPLSTARIYADKEFDFGVALKLLKSRYRVYRSGWNGKGMYVFLLKAIQIPISNEISLVTEIAVGTVCNFLPHLMMKTASVETEFVPWNPTQSDVLGEDWRIDFS